MDIKQIILNYVKEKNKKLEIAGLRGLVKSGEYEWSFRFTYMDGDFLSISKMFKVRLEGINRTPVLIKNKTTKNKPLKNKIYGRKQFK